MQDGEHSFRDLHLSVSLYFILFGTLSSVLFLNPIFLLDLNSTTVSEVGPASMLSGHIHRCFLCLRHYLLQLSTPDLC